MEIRHARGRMNGQWSVSDSFTPRVDMKSWCALTKSELCESNLASGCSEDHLDKY